VRWSFSVCYESAYLIVLGKSPGWKGSAAQTIVIILLQFCALIHFLHLFDSSKLPSTEQPKRLQNTDGSLGVLK